MRAMYHTYFTTSIYIINSRFYRSCGAEFRSIVSYSVATAWFESRKLDKLSHIEAEPSCCNSFGLAMAWLWPKMALSGCKQLKCDFVPNLAKVCLSPFILSLDHSITFPCLLGTRYVTQILSELGTLVYGTQRHPPGVCRSREGR